MTLGTIINLESQANCALRLVPRLLYFLSVIYPASRMYSIIDYPLNKFKGELKGLSIVKLNIFDIETSNVSR